MFFPRVAQGWNYRIVLIARAPGRSREQNGMESEEGDSAGQSQRLSVEITAPSEALGTVFQLSHGSLLMSYFPFLCLSFLI